MATRDSYEPGTPSAGSTSASPDLDAAVGVLRRPVRLDQRGGAARERAATGCACSATSRSPGIGPQVQPATRPWWTTYVTVADCRRHRRQGVEAAGGSVVVDPLDVMDRRPHGRVRRSRTARRSRCGSRSDHIGARYVNEHGAFMLERARDLRTSTTASSVLRRRLRLGPTSRSESSTAPTSCSCSATTPIGSIRGDRRRAARRWAVYFHVDDCDATVARVAELGGTSLGDAVRRPRASAASPCSPTTTATVALHHPARRCTWPTSGSTR